MTPEELVKHFNDTIFSQIYSVIPLTHEVDLETYARVVQYIFDTASPSYPRFSWGTFHSIALGPNKGLMFKGIELLIKK